MLGFHGLDICIDINTECPKQTYLNPVSFFGHLNLICTGCLSPDYEFGYRGGGCKVRHLYHSRNTDVGSHLSAWPLLPGWSRSEGKRIGHGAVTFLPAHNGEPCKSSTPPAWPACPATTMRLE